MIVWLASAVATNALAADVPADVVQDLGSGVSVNWTTLQLQIRGSARGAAAQNTEAVEQLARRDVDAAIAQVVGSVPVAAGAVFDDLLAEPSLATAMGTRTSRWIVTTTAYHASGRVVVDAELSLQHLLKPWTLQIASTTVETAPDVPWTGLVVDGRGTGVRPAFAPRIVDPRGTSVYRGELWEEEAVSEAPFVYVSDPAHPAALRAGERPLFVSAVRADGADLVLSVEDAARVRDEVVALGVLGRGRAVVVVDGY